MSYLKCFYLWVTFFAIELLFLILYPIDPKTERTFYWIAIVNFIFSILMSIGYAVAHIKTLKDK